MKLRRLSLYFLSFILTRSACIASFAEVRGGDEQIGDINNAILIHVRFGMFKRLHACELLSDKEFLKG